jgi:hypothetical protein
LVIEPVNDSVCLHDDFPNGVIAKFRRHPTSLWELASAFSVLNQRSAKAKGLIRIVN